jgi:hypothetical protein
MSGLNHGVVHCTVVEVTRNTIVLDFGAIAAYEAYEFTIVPNVKVVASGDGMMGSGGHYVGLHIEANEFHFKENTVFERCCIVMTTNLDVVPSSFKNVEFRNCAVYCASLNAGITQFEGCTMWDCGVWTYCIFNGYNEALHVGVSTMHVVGTLWARGLRLGMVRIEVGATLDVTSTLRGISGPEGFYATPLYTPTILNHGSLAGQGNSADVAYQGYPGSTLKWAEQTMDFILALQHSVGTTEYDQSVLFVDCTVYGLSREYGLSNGLRNITVASVPIGTRVRFYTLGVVSHVITFTDPLNGGATTATFAAGGWNEWCELIYTGSGWVSLDVNNVVYS